MPNTPYQIPTAHSQIPNTPFQIPTAPSQIPNAGPYGRFWDIDSFASLHSVYTIKLKTIFHEPKKAGKLKEM